MKRLTRDLAEHGIYTIADLHQAYLANSFTRISAFMDMWDSLQRRVNLVWLIWAS